MALIDIHNLNVRFKTSSGMIPANSNINLTIGKNENLGLIGETGCGKSILGHALVRLLPESAVMTGRICYRGKDLLTLGEEEMRKIRGRQIAMIFQKPHSALNPVLTVYDQIMEIYRYRLNIPAEEIEAATRRLLENVGIDPSRMKEYPHQFSGGMLQRIMIAMGIAFRPKLLVADEITKGLDRPVKWKIAELIRQVTAECGMLMITHDLIIANDLCERIAVMYAGEIVEINHAEAVFNHPRHPYTKGLIDALPSSGMHAISGHTPSLTRLPAGCRFYPRCPVKKRGCRQHHPRLRALGGGGYVRCI